jgi:hypothetical protein
VFAEQTIYLICGDCESVDKFSANKRLSVIPVAMRTEIHYAHQLVDKVVSNPVVVADGSLKRRMNFISITS